MSRITDLRAAVKTALAGLDGRVEVYDWPTPDPELPCAIVGDGEPLVEQALDEDSGFTVRKVSFRLLLGVSPKAERDAFARLETWIDQLDDLMAVVVPPAGVTTPVVTSISARGQVTYAETQLVGVFVDLEALDQFC